MAEDAKVEEVEYELVDEIDGEPVNGAEFGDPVTGDRIELKPGQKVKVPVSLAAEFESMPFLQPVAKKSSSKKAEED